MHVHNGVHIYKIILGTPICICTLNFVTHPPLEKLDPPLHVHYRYGPKSFTNELSLPDARNDQLL